MSGKNKYKGITFCESWKASNKTFEMFKAEFEDIWVFKAFAPKERLSELKKAFQIATHDPNSKAIKEIKVKDSKTVTEEK